MAMKLYNDVDIQNIADSIRTKNGESTTYKVSEMADAIDDLTVLDLSQVTATSNTITSGYKAYDSSGTLVTGSAKEVKDVVWNQCPQAPANFVEHVNYEPNDYTTSEVLNYVPSPIDNSATKPIPYTIDERAFYNSVPEERRPFETPNYIGHMRGTFPLRWIYGETRNFRDIGGWSCDGDTVVRYGMIYRSADLNANDEYIICTELGIKTEIDLTNDGVKAYNGIKHYVTHTTSPMYSLSDTAAWRVYLRAIFDAVSYETPVIVHCSMGADRTGTIMCILEGLLGVSQSDIDKDYELTSFTWTRQRNGNYQGGTADWAHLISQINALNGSTFRDKVVTFVLSLGFSIDEINEFRRVMTNGMASSVHPSETLTATITRSLTDVSSSNTASTISYYQKYETTLTPASGYNFTNVSITMGGADIKNSCYVEEIFPTNVGRISIPSVTGNISITAVAEPPYPNQIPISTDASGNVYNTTGYKEGYRLNSSGNEAAFSGSFVTGFIPFTFGQTIMFDKFDGTESSNGGIYFYNASHRILCGHRVNRMLQDAEFTVGEAITWTPQQTVYDGGSGTMKDISTAAYIRIAAKSDPSEAVCYVYD